jgi:hypothetical protein
MHSDTRIRLGTQAIGLSDIGLQKLSVAQLWKWRGLLWPPPTPPLFDSFLHYLLACCHHAQNFGPPLQPRGHIFVLVGQARLQFSIIPSRIAMSFKFIKKLEDFLKKISKLIHSLTAHGERIFYWPPSSLAARRREMKRRERQLKR